MSQSTNFDDTSLMGNMSFDQVIAKLREMDDEETAVDLEAARDDYYAQDGTLSAPDTNEESNKWKRYWNRPWTSTEYTVGYIDAKLTGDPLPIHYAGNIAPSINLRNARIKITLDRFRVMNYPGLGSHRILLKFHTQNQIHRKSEDIHFNVVCNAHQGEHANIHSYPIFTGLNLGNEGINLEFVTIRIHNNKDKNFLKFLESDVFKSGLQLLTSAQPAIALFANTVSSLTSYIAKNWGNGEVQRYTLGLDFHQTLDHYRLSEGTYIVVQIPEKEIANWEWDQWQYQSTKGLVVNKNKHAMLIPYNYLILSISKMKDS